MPEKEKDEKGKGTSAGYTGSPDILVAVHLPNICLIFTRECDIA